VTDNWSDQTYATMHGTDCVVANNTFITPGDPFPSPAQGIMAAAGVLPGHAGWAMVPAWMRARLAVRVGA
jgi:hypothetical protein